MSHIQIAFDELIESQEPEYYYLCLMESVPYYGGPEEGGWYGNDSILVAYKQYPSRELAESAAESVRQLAEQLSNESRKEYGEHCLKEMDWCDERSLDYDYLGEPDGPSHHYVMITETIPENIYGPRQYS